MHVQSENKPLMESMPIASSLWTSDLPSSVSQCNKQVCSYIHYSVK